MARILIVEDNPHNMKLAVFLLEFAGHQILEARDASTGIALAREHRPDLVLMDIHLSGMDGLSASKALKSAPDTADLRIYALTAFAMKGDEEKIREAGCDGYIPKPIRNTDFLDIIAAALA
jgi:two-component system cell cycle response regulator DivK